MAMPNTFGRRQIFFEWGFVTLLLVLCALLTVLQYRWTGEVSRAEAAALRAGLGEQVQALARTFDRELSEACTALRPTRVDLIGTNCHSAFLARWRDWRATNPRPIFRRAAVAVPSRGSVDLFATDESAGRAVPIEWPADWTNLRDYVMHMVGGGRPAFSDLSGELIEFPIFGDGPGRPGSESGWLLLQLDMDYVRNTWLPELVWSHLSFNGKAPYDVTVAVASTGRKLFSSPPGAGAAIEEALTLRFHRQGRLEISRGGRRAGPIVGKEALWSLRAGPRAGALEALVTTSRWRNLAVAVAVNGLIFAAGIALVFQTGRSRKLAEAQMNFVASVSHELRTPLTVIRGAAHNLLRRVVKEPGQVEEYSRLIIRHAEQLKELVEQTLALAGADKARETMRRERVELPALLNEAVAAVADDTQAAGCVVQVELPPSLPAVTGDAAALCRAFQNLLTNAVKHGGDGKWIGLSAASIDGGLPPMVEVRIADRGPGIPASEQAEIFKPFFRGTVARERQIRGSGLGLSVVRAIVESHGGTVSVESGVPQGSKFIVRIPAQS